MSVAARVVRDPYDPRFPHGTTRGYARLCSCDECRASHANAEAKRAWNAMNGKVPLTDAEPVRAHLAAVVAATGCTARQVTMATGQNRRVVLHVLAGSRSRVRQETAAALLAFTGAHVPEPPPQYVPRQRAEFMVRTLQAHGWPLQWQAEKLGQPNLQGPRFLWDTRSPFVARRTMAAVAALHRRYRYVEGPDDGARREARHLGFFPYAAYDEDGEPDEYGRPPLATLAVNRKTVPTGKARTSTHHDRERNGATRWATLAKTLAGQPSSAIARAERTTARTVSRYRVELGLRWTATVPLRPEPGQEEELAMARDALARYRGNPSNPRGQWEELRAALARLRQHRDANTAAA